MSNDTGKFNLSAFFQNNDVITSAVLEGLEIKISDIFVRPFES